jgi:hypothetical protein
MYPDSRCRANEAQHPSHKAHTTFSQPWTQVQQHVFGLRASRSDAEACTQWDHGPSQRCLMHQRTHVRSFPSWIKRFLGPAFSDYAHFSFLFGFFQCTVKYPSNPYSQVTLAIHAVAGAHTSTHRRKDDRFMTDIYGYYCKCGSDASSTGRCANVAAWHAHPRWAWYTNGPSSNRRLSAARCALLSLARRCWR